MTEITLKLTVDELKMIDKYVELKDETQPLFNKIRNAYPKPTTLFDVIRNLGYSIDMCYEIVDAVEEFEKSKEPEEEPEELKTLSNKLEEWIEKLNFTQSKEHKDLLVIEILNIVKEFIPEPKMCDDEDYDAGYNEAIKKMEENLK